jgi:hypothetical protein
MLGSIYKITSPQTNKVYYGSTILSLKERFRLHYVKYKRYINGKITKLEVFDILQFDDSKIELLDEYEVNTQKELLIYERKYIIENECCNKSIPLRTGKEWECVNRKRINENARKRYDFNKSKEIREQNKEKIKNTKAIWYLKNRERLIQKQKEYDANQKLIKQNTE